ncbi:MAG: MBOAT family O-acyltransferase [Crocinitomicaceae bacterium]|nr:MBOAT family O-acyltransferase [Crocinitomicaceae bacterium]
MERLYNIFSFEIGEGDTLSFSKLDFWIFFLLVMILFGFLNKKKTLRSVYLTFISLFFFYKTSGLYMILLVVSITANYFLGRQIFKVEKERSRKAIIVISALFNLLILGYFKYAYFFTDSFNEMFGTSYELVNHFAQFGNGFFGDGTFVEKIMLPIGVSFFTFQNISYVVDIYRKQVEPVKNFFHYSFFVTFFPQLVMGPIVRARDFIPQITEPYSLTKKEFSWAVIQIMKGLVKQIVIANFLVMNFIDLIVFTPDSFPGYVSVIAMWAYSLHIYADFSAYTDIAIGISRLMGFKLKPNFNSPYKARNVADFWRRWHMSLGSWLKDYLYIPLGGNRTGSVGSYIAIFLIFTFLIFITQWYDLLYIYAGLSAIYILGMLLFKNFKRYVHRDLNLLITMVVGGLWHGPSENFVIWGAMNGLALVIFKYWGKINKFFIGKIPLWQLMKPGLAFGIYMLATVFFPDARRIVIIYFFYIWIGISMLALLAKVSWKPLFYLVKAKWQFWLSIVSMASLGGYILLVNFKPEYYSIEYFYWNSAVLSLSLLFVYLRWKSERVNLYEYTKDRYIGFWQIFITFNFITFTRIWFKLDEVRVSVSNPGGISNEEADKLPGKMLDTIWNHFDFTWESLTILWDNYHAVFWIMIGGFIFHWLPNKIKAIYEKAFTAMPLPVQTIIVAIIVILIYQAMGAGQPKNVYMRF